MYKVVDFKHCYTSMEYITASAQVNFIVEDRRRKNDLVRRSRQSTQVVHVDAKRIGDRLPTWRQTADMVCPSHTLVKRGSPYSVHFSLLSRYNLNVFVSFPSSVHGTLQTCSRLGHRFDGGHIKSPFVALVIYHHGQRRGVRRFRRAGIKKHLNKEQM